MLRKMGYTLRPVKMDERNSVQKEAIDRMHYPSKFASQTSDDGFYQVSIPGKKFYRFTDWYGMDVVQNADMVNGAYYMVTRIKTNALHWGHSADFIHRRIDSFLYENVPGKILKKTPITRNGYKGWDIQNRTRRGDHQRYHILVTPFEILFFKMSGNGDFVRTGTEAQQFFGSIKLKEYAPGEWTKYSPPTGGFSVQLPHRPHVIRDQYFGADRFEYGAFDSKGNSYLIMQSSLHNYSYAEEDSFELNLMGDSYGHSVFIEKELSRQFAKQNGFPAMDAKYRHKDGSFSTVRYVIRGPLYYVLAAHHKNENENIKPFLESFSIAPFVYPAVKLHTDTAMHFTVASPVFRDTAGKETEEFDEYTAFFRMAMEDEESELYGLGDRYKSVVIGNDTVGEKIYVSYVAPSQYLFEKDSTKFWKTVLGSEINDDSSFIVKKDHQSVLADGSTVRDVHLTDTGSSRIILWKIIYKNGHLFSLSALSDTLSQPGAFLSSFFNTFRPADTLKGEPLFARKTERFFQDFFSSDSATARKARRSMSEMKFDSLDVAHLKNAINRINWNTKNYLGTKKYFIGHLGGIKEPSVIPYLRELYGKVKDTADLQKAVLNALLKQRTKESFAAFKDLILQEPPISDGSYEYDGMDDFSINRSSIAIRHSVDFDAGDDRTYYGPWGELYDTLSLTQTIFPDLLQLMSVDDYKENVRNLLVKLVDSGYVKGTAYEMHFSKLYLDAKQLLKKQMAGEERENIEKLSRKDRSFSIFDYEEDEEKELDRGNSELEQYAVLLLPFYDKNPGVPAFFDQLLKTRDRQLLYNTFILLLRNNRPVPDSLFLKYAKVDEYRAKLYEDLQQMKKPDRFPAAYKSQELMAKSLLLKNRYYYNKPDTLVYLDKLPVTYKKQNGFVYFFKYKEGRDDVTWKLASVGMQPAKQDSVDIKNREFTAMGERKLENNVPLDEQLQKMLKELLYEKRMSAAGFYNGRNRYDLYKTYLPDMVKSRRYRD